MKNWLLKKGRLGRGISLLFLGGFLLGTSLAWAQAYGYPSKPIDVIVPFDPGGSVDISSRILLDQLSRELRTPFVVKNISGAGGLTGAASALKAMTAWGDLNLKWPCPPKGVHF